MASVWALAYQDFSLVGNAAVGVVSCLPLPRLSCRGSLTRDVRHDVCFPWGLPGVAGDSPWAGFAAEGAGNLLDCSMGSYSSHLPHEWDVLDGSDREGAVGRMLENPIGRRYLSTPSVGCCSCGGR